MEIEDTIVALASPPGTSALAIIRISGKDAISIVSSRIQQKNKFDNLKEKTISLFNITDPQIGTIDQITAIKYIQPNSYTGENMVEIICHGGELIVSKIIDSLMNAGARYANRGEFTKRAVFHGKMDLIKAESTLELIESKSEQQHQNAIKTYLGEHLTKTNNWKKELNEISVILEAYIEFPEEIEIENECIEKIKMLREDIENEISKAKLFENQFTKDFQIAIIGPPNSGKSSLFNFILKSNRAIVHHIAGTTRDSISEQIILSGTRVTLIDTAGLIDTNDEVEKMGVERSWQLARECEIILWVTSTENQLVDQELQLLKLKKKGTIIGIINKTDLKESKVKEIIMKEWNIPYLCVSIKNGHNTEKIKEVLETIIKDKINLLPSSIILNKRHMTILTKMAQELKNGEKYLEKETEFAAKHIKNALSCLNEYYGRQEDEKIIEMIFQKFCIGK